MKVVSNQSEQERRAAEAKHRFERALQELAANIMRVAGGAGRPQEIALQILRCAGTMAACRFGASGVEAWDVAPILDVCKDTSLGDEADADNQMKCMEDVIRGALQVAAWRLLNQGL